MKKIIALFVVIGSLGTYIFLSKSSAAVTVGSSSDTVGTLVKKDTTTSKSLPTSPTLNTRTPNSAPHEVVKSTPKSTPPTPIPIPTQKPTGQYKDGSYSGDSVDAVYGMVQVSAVISGGKLSSVQIIKSPSGRGQTNEITRNAIPTLIQEALTAQSAKINGVSGATQTSQGFTDSLSSALLKAKV